MRYRLTSGLGPEHRPELRRDTGNCIRCEPRQIRTRAVRSRLLLLGFDAMFAWLDPTKMRERADHADRSMAAYSQIANIVEEDHSG